MTLNKLAMKARERILQFRVSTRQPIKRQWVFFGAIWPLHLGTLRKLHTKHWFALRPIWHPYHESQIGQVEKVQRTAARWTCRRWRNTSSVGDMLDELEWPSLETHREQSSLTFFYKIHSGTVSLDKDKYRLQT